MFLPPAITPASSPFIGPSSVAKSADGAPSFYNIAFNNLYGTLNNTIVHTRSRNISRGLCWIAALFISSSPALLADTPLGWINSANPSAYTLNKNQLEISFTGLAVNDTLDVFNIRDELLESNQRLEGDSGDLGGGKLEIHYGLSRNLTLFLKHQQHDLTIDLAPIESINLLDIDEALDTELSSLGVKWVFFEGNLLNSNGNHSAASLELSAFSNRSDDFELLLDEIHLDNIDIFFRDPQTFSVANLEDEGWKARLAYTFPMGRLGTTSIWAGYSQAKATSATTTDITVETIARFFEQEFELEETYFTLGASLLIPITPRLPLIISYEYTNISKSDLQRDPAEPAFDLPGFLQNTAATEDDNHALHARLSYWLTPNLNLGLTANLYSNQFLGVIPHYNNPLSGSFSSVPYGFAGLELAYKF